MIFPRQINDSRPRAELTGFNAGPLPSLVWRSLNFAVMSVALVALLGAVALVAGPRLLGWQGVVVLSGSMEPTLQTGGVAFVQPADASEIQVGDILTHRPLPTSGSRWSTWEAGPQAPGSPFHVSTLWRWCLS